MTDTDRQLLRELQRGLPVTERPFAYCAKKLSCSESEVIRRIKAMRKSGIIRKFGGFLNHRRAGFTANGMVVCNVPEEQVQSLGLALAGFDCVSHCYARPSTDLWPYRLYAMVHGHSQREVRKQVSRMMKECGITDYRILFSKREWKKSADWLESEEDATTRR